MATGAHQTLILHIAIVLGREDLGATLAFLLAADIAHDAIDGDGITPFVEPLDHDIIAVDPSPPVFLMLALRAQPRRAGGRPCGGVSLGGTLNVSRSGQQEWLSVDARGVWSKLITKARI